MSYFLSVSEHHDWVFVIEIWMTFLSGQLASSVWKGSQYDDLWILQFWLAPNQISTCMTLKVWELSFALKSRNQVIEFWALSCSV
jgi:hypothetical protein